MPDVVALCYHATSPAWPNELSVEPDALARQVRMLLDRGYAPVRFADLLAGARGRRVAVTFDDAYRSTYELAWPALRELGVPATVYAPVDFVGANGPMSWPGIDDAAAGPHAAELRCMTWEQLGELHEAGWEIGSHTCSHPRLTECDGARLERELVASREAIAALDAPDWQKTILRAMAHYGMFVGDTGGSPWGVQFESGSTYTSFGQADPWVTWAKQQPGESDWQGRQYLPRIGGVDWDSRLKVVDPCVDQGSC